MENSKIKNILVIDNHDSFVYNLVQILRENEHYLIKSHNDKQQIDSRWEDDAVSLGHLCDALLRNDR